MGGMGGGERERSGIEGEWGEGGTRKKYHQFVFC